MIEPSVAMPRSCCPRRSPGSRKAVPRSGFGGWYRGPAPTRRSRRVAARPPGEYLSSDGGPVRQLDADSGPCVRLRRLRGFRIGFIQAGEDGGSHEPSIASGASGQAASLGPHGDERALGPRSLHHPCGGLPRFLACVVEKDQARSRADAGDRTHRPADDSPRTRNGNTTPS